MISYTETPIQEIYDPLMAQRGIRLLVKREDLNHAEVSGNKWWKLKHNLARAVEEGAKTLLSFGGAYSNHLYALAGAASILGLRSIGIIRGEESNPLNSTLAYARSRGMHLHFVSREEYRKKSEISFVQQLRERFGNFYLIPEGGTNALAVKGCAEFGEKLVREIDFDYICLPVGTGGTMAGIVKSLQAGQTAIGFSVLKNGGFLEAEVRAWIAGENSVGVNWRIETNYDFGGYAKTTPALVKFIQEQKELHGLPLDQVYTAKALFGIYDLIRRNEIKKGVVLMLHTGGLQGATSAK